VQIVAVDDGPSKRAVAAFVVPNQAIPAEKPLEDFLVPLDQLELLCGIDFGPALLNGLSTADTPPAPPTPAPVPVPAPAPVTPDATPALPATAGARDTPVVPTLPFLRPGATVGRNYSDLCGIVRCTLPAADFWVRPDTPELPK
jgi:hypothetical protein